MLIRYSGNNVIYYARDLDLLGLIIKLVKTQDQGCCLENKRSIINVAEEIKEIMTRVLSMEKTTWSVGLLVMTWSFWLQNKF